MTRTARKGKQSSITGATPWKKLKYKQQVDEEEGPSGEGTGALDSSSSVNDVSITTVKKGNLKRTNKTKLKEKSMQALATKVKTLKQKEKDNTDGSDIAMLLPEGSETEEAATKKRGKTKRQSVSFGEDSILLFHKNSRVGDGESYASMKRRKQIDARRLRRQKRKVCFNCRKPGHLVQDCPGPQGDSASGLCFKCGASDHTSKSCTTATGDDFPYAKCFICGETGHIAKSCPDNPKGLYPNGGCCRFCGSVEHLRANCPEVSATKSHGFSAKGLVIVNPHASADDEEQMVSLATPSKRNSIKKSARAAGHKASTNKIVNF